ncbi:MAG: hypothetical protein NVSMB53_00970 [Gemmatimonadaceae bacterium]
MNRECRGIVIRVAAFVWVREHDVGSHLFNQIRDVEHELYHLLSRFPIDIAESAASVRSDSHMCECIRDLASPGTGVLFASSKSFALRVPLVAGCAICYVHNNGIGNSGEEPAGPNRFVVRMGHDHEYARMRPPESRALDNGIEHCVRDFCRRPVARIPIWVDDENRSSNQGRRSLPIRLMFLDQARDEKKIAPISRRVVSVEREGHSELVALSEWYLRTERALRLMRLKLHATAPPS